MRNKYKLLNHVNEIFEDVNLSKTLLISCQHLLGGQLLMFRRLFKQGLQPENCFVIGKNYSTSKIAYEKFKSFGCYVDEASVQYSPSTCFDEWFSVQLKAFYAKVLSSVDITKFDTIVLLDDGGMLIYEAIQSILPFEKVRAIEQTSSGWAKLRGNEIPFDVFYVARTYVKLVHETPFITKLCFERCVEHIKKRKIENAKVLIIGNQGFIGKSLQGRFKFAGYHVTGCDIKMGTLSEQTEAQLSSYDIVIGTTGSQSVSEQEIAAMKPTVSLISVSSSDREFPALLFRNKGTVLHQDHYLGERCLVNSGFPITFYGNYVEVPQNQIEITLSLLLFGVYMASLDIHDWRKNGSQFTAIIVGRLKEMYFEQISEKDYVYVT